jgi:hypothetical protein
MRPITSALLLIATLSTALAQEADALHIENATVVSVETSPNTRHEVERSTELNSWDSFTTLKGDGQVWSNTFVGGSRSFFRLKSENYPVLTGISITSGAAPVTPQFDSSIYHYYFRLQTQSVQLNVQFDPAPLSKATLNDLPITPGVQSLQLSTNDQIQIVLTSTNQLTTRYVLEVVPSSFPKISVTNFVRPSEPQVTLMGAKATGPGHYLMVIDDNGVPIWSKGVPLGHNLQLQKNGLISYVVFTGTNSAGEQLSHNVVMDPFLNELFAIKPTNGYNNDVHTFTMTRSGSYLLLGFSNAVHEVQTPDGLTNTTMRDAVVQEIKWPSGELLFEWNSWRKFDLDNVKYPEPADYAHINWIDEDTDGHLLLSARSQSQVIKVHRTTREIMWRLGRGGHFTFIDDPKNGFAGQHSAHRLPNGNLLIFDNRNFATTNAVIASEGPSRVVEYRLDEQAKSATLVWSYSRDGFHTTSNGGAYRMENGNTLISWGRTPPGFITEVDPSGAIVTDIRVVDDANRDMIGYIAYKFPASQMPWARWKMNWGPQ